MTASVLALLLAASVPGGEPAAHGEPGYYVTEGSNESGVYTGYAGHIDLMPQNGYSPRYGCYPGGSSRHIHRYPAFHGWHYRKPYNYRQMFDYPWHAGLHEPTSLWGYNVEEQQIRPEVRNATPSVSDQSAARARSGRYPTASRRGDVRAANNATRKQTDVKASQANASQSAMQQVQVAGESQASPVVFVKRGLDPQDLEVLMEQVERRVRAEDERDERERAEKVGIDQAASEATEKNIPKVVKTNVLRNALSDEAPAPTENAESTVTTSDVESSQPTTSAVIPASGTREITNTPSPTKKVQITDSFPASSSASGSKLSWRAKNR